MVKLTLEQVESLINDDKMNVTELKEHMKEGYNSEDIEVYFTKKIQSMEDMDSDTDFDGGEDEGNGFD